MNGINRIQHITYLAVAQLREIPRIQKINLLIYRVLKIENMKVIAYSIKNEVVQKYNVLTNYS